MGKLITSVVLIAGISTAGVVWGDGYAKMLTITPSEYAGQTELEDYPLLVKLSEQTIPEFRYADFQTQDGSDMAFALSDGTPLAYEIDTWDRSGTSLVWVKVPILTKTTSITMTFGGASNIENTPSSVWSSYDGVWHLDGEGDGEGHTEKDSSPGGYTANTGDKTVGGATGVIGLARTMETAKPTNKPAAGKTTTGGIVAPGWANMDLSDGIVTMSAWVKFASGTHYYDHIFNNKEKANSAYGFAQEAYGGTISTLVCYGGNATAKKPSISALVADQWVHLVLAYSGTTLYVYANGSLVSTQTGIGQVKTSSYGLGIGNGGTGNDCAFFGDMDEARIHRWTPSADWVQADYLAVKDGLCTFSAVGDTDPTKRMPAFAGVTVSGTASDGLAIGCALSSDGAQPVHVDCYVGSSPDALSVVGSWDDVTTRTSMSVVSTDIDSSCAFVKFVATMMVEGEPKVIETSLVPALLLNGVWYDETLAASHIQYVDPLRGRDSYPGSLPDRPKATLKASLAALETNGGRIYLSAGTHVLSDIRAVLTNAVEVIGMTGRPEDVTVKSTYRETGNFSGQTFVLDNPDACVRDVTITGGYCRNVSDGGGNVQIRSNGGSLVNCIVTGGEMSCAFYGSGSGIRSLATRDVLISHCVITNNSMVGTSNANGTTPCAVYMAGGKIENSVVAWNKDTGTVGNRTGAGGIYANGAVEIVNCTVVGNRCSQTNAVNAGGVLLGNGAMMKNTVVAANQIPFVADGSTETDWVTSAINYGKNCSVESLTTCASDAGESVEGRLVVESSVDALFFNVTEHNLNPGRASVLKDRGTAYEGAESDTDVEGKNRIIGAAIDIGAYEYEETAVSSMYVTAVPSEIGSPSPAYGKIEDGSALTTYTGPADLVSDAGTTRYHCTGYVVYTNNAANVWTEEIRGADTSLSYATQPGRDSRIVWQLQTEHFASVTNGNAYGSVSGPEGWFVSGSEQTFTAAPVEGYVVSAWYVDGVLQVGQTGNSLTLTPTSPVSVVVRFRPSNVVENVQYVKTVEEGGDDSNHGYTLEAAKATLQSAVNELGDAGGTVWVQAGRYQIPSTNVNVTVASPIRVIGATGNPEDVVLFRPSTEQVSSDYPNHAILRLNHREASVANMVLEGGVTYQNAINGNCLSIGPDGGTATNCVMRGGRFWVGHIRAAVSLESDDALVTHCVVTNCTFTGDENASWYSTIPIGVYMTKGRFENSLVANCRVREELTEDKVTLPRTCAVHVTGGKMRNVTIAGCTGALAGGVVVSPANSTTAIENCVVADCATAVTGGSSPWRVDEAYKGSITHCACDVAVAPGVSSVTGTTTTLFKDYAKGDLTPAAGGPLYNAGAAWDGAPATDLAGKPRVQGRGVDIGCYEAAPAGFVISIQ